MTDKTTRLARARRILMRAKPAVAALLFIGSLVTLALSAAAWLEERSQNRVIEALASGRDVAIPDGAPARLVLARAHFLLSRDRIDEAQPLLDKPSLRSDAGAHALIFYNMANARLRAAIAFVESQKVDQAISMISLAKEEYRQALRLSPDNWDIKYNYDVALRMVRDFPQLQLEQEDDDTGEPAQKQLWTDLPNVPKGLP